MPKDFDDIDWSDPNAEAVDGFTVAQIEAFALDSLVEAVCSDCGERHTVEPDARGYRCWQCLTSGSITSPLVKLGLI